MTDDQKPQQQTTVTRLSNLCDAGRWNIEADKICPVCGAPPEEFCRPASDDEAAQQRAAAWQKENSHQQSTLHEMPVAIMQRAWKWRQDHSLHVERVAKERSDGALSYPPSGSDMYHPELWRAPHWRWFNGVWP